MRSKRTLVAAVAAVALMAGLPSRAASTAPGVHFGIPTTGHPSTYTWTGTVLQAPGSSSDVATPTSPKACKAASGVCEDIPLTVPAGLKTSTLYVRVAWRSPVWKAYLYVTNPDGTKVYPSTASAATATDCDQGLFNKGCGNETPRPLDEVTIPNPAPGTWKVRVAAVNIHDERYTGLASLTASRPLQYVKESLAQLTKHLTRSQRINIVFAGWQPSKSELADLRGSLPNEYIPAVVSKRAADGDSATDSPASGLVQHQAVHYTATDPTRSDTVPT